jgi:hypothetical protein
MATPQVIKSQIIKLHLEENRLIKDIQNLQLELKRVKFERERLESIPGVKEFQVSSRVYTPRRSIPEQFYRR